MSRSEMAEHSNSLVDTLQVEKRDLLRFLRNRLGCADAADDVYQHISEQLHTAPPEAPVAQPRAYLFRTAANAANSHLRAQNTRASYEEAAAAQMAQSELRDPERVAFGRRALEVVEAALADLPVLTRQVFVAARYHGVSQKAIAGRYRVSLSTVEKHLAKATRHCHRQLRAAGFSGALRTPRLVHERTLGPETDA
ncbi:MAG: RNA polymerase sigma factor [Pseudomonadota bacterium]